MGSTDYLVQLDIPCYDQWRIKPLVDSARRDPLRRFDLQPPQKCRRASFAYFAGLGK